MRLASLLLAVAACAPETTDPADTCGSVLCGGGEVCDRSVADPVCVSGTADPDGDGIPNKDDVCPNLAGGSSYDEDGDGVGDACDRCPIAANTEPDGDGDDVDSPCDPNPTTPGDHILVFEGFREPPSNVVLPAGWVVQGGEAIADQAGPSPGFLAIPIASSNRLAVEASYRIDKIVSGGNATPAVSTKTRDKRPAGTVEYLCGVAKMASVEGVQVTTDVDSSQALAENMFDTAALYRNGFLIDGGQTACAVVANEQVKNSASVRSGGNAMSEAGIDVAFAKARFQWLMILSWTNAGT